TTNATSNTLTKIGGGDVVLAGANTFVGATDIQQGNLVIHNPNALGNASLPGVQALSVLSTSAPVQNAPSLTTGGSITFDTTFFYEITAIGPAGESIASNEKSITTNAASQAVKLSWNQVNGATGYNIYRSTTSAP